MIRWLFQTLAVATALGAVGMPAFATQCYEIIDRNDAVILRDTKPPVDMSDAGAPAREALRRRGELFIFYDVESCVVVGRAAATGNRTLTTEEIVAGWRSVGKGGFGDTYGSTLATDSGGGISAPMPTNAGRASAADRPINLRLRY